MSDILVLIADALGSVTHNILVPITDSLNRYMIVCMLESVYKVWPSGGIFLWCVIVVNQLFGQKWIMIDNFHSFRILMCSSMHLEVLNSLADMNECFGWCLVISFWVLVHHHGLDYARGFQVAKWMVKEASIVIESVLTIQLL